jgi:hypothetical protein
LGQETGDPRSAFTLIEGTGAGHRVVFDHIEENSSGGLAPRFDFRPLCFEAYTLGGLLLRAYPCVP